MGLKIGDSSESALMWEYRSGCTIRLPAGASGLGLLMGDLQALRCQTRSTRLSLSCRCHTLVPWIGRRRNSPTRSCHALVARIHRGCWACAKPEIEFQISK